MVLRLAHKTDINGQTPLMVLFWSARAENTTFDSPAFKQLYELNRKSVSINGFTPKSCLNAHNKHLLERDLWFKNDFLNLDDAKTKSDAISLDLFEQKE